MSQDQVTDEAQALVQMYYAGFYDAVNEYGSRRRVIGWKKHCIEAFDKRFKKGIMKSVDKGVDELKDRPEVSETIKYTQTLSREKIIKT